MLYVRQAQLGLCCMWECCYSYHISWGKFQLVLEEEKEVVQSQADQGFTVARKPSKLLETSSLLIWHVCNTLRWHKWRVLVQVTSLNSTVNARIVLSTTCRMWTARSSLRRMVLKRMTVQNILSLPCGYPYMVVISDSRKSPDDSYHKSKYFSVLFSSMARQN